jgi:hypothetical protein
MNATQNEIIITDIIPNEKETVLVSIEIERFNKLELLERTLPNIIENAIIEHNKNKLKILHEKDKLNPAAVNARVKRYNERHKDEINARRIAKRNEGKTGISPVQENSVIKSLMAPKKTDAPVLKTVVSSINKEMTIYF